MKHTLPIVALVAAMLLAKTSRAISIEEFSARVPDAVLGSVVVMLPARVRDWAHLG
jgi:hypothetical protein